MLPSIVGVTGTVKGATTRQFMVLREITESFCFSEFHHGDAIGVDAQSHAIALRLKNARAASAAPLRIVIHPPIRDAKRAFCEGADEVREMKEYLDRDQDIASEVSVLLAVPETAEEQIRSGTWSTVRYARKRAGVLIIRINPDGTVRFG